jgi:N utilization substance protein A
MPRAQNYERGKRLQCLILSVKNEARGAPVIVSRTHQDLIAVLFEQEVPEIYEGQVRIMAIARDPGNRAKVAVQATEEGIDAVGTCVGVKGTRVQNIISELDGEKIDLVEWSEDISAFIANALGRRAGVRRVELDDESKSAHVIVPDDKLSLAIGQRGQNARLAARLTGWKVDIKGESEASVSINELFKPEEPDSDEADERMLDSPEDGTDENIEEQTADTPDPMDATDVEGDTDVNTAEVEASETSDEESLLISSEENIETLDVTAENDDLDPESE